MSYSGQIALYRHYIHSLYLGVGLLKQDADANKPAVIFAFTGPA